MLICSFCWLRIGDKRWTFLITYHGLLDGLYFHNLYSIIPLKIYIPGPPLVILFSIKTVVENADSLQCKIGTLLTKVPDNYVLWASGVPILFNETLIVCLQPSFIIITYRARLLQDKEILLAHFAKRKRRVCSFLGTSRRKDSHVKLKTWQLDAHHCVKKALVAHGPSYVNHKN